MNRQPAPPSSSMMPSPSGDDEQPADIPSPELTASHLALALGLPPPTDEQIDVIQAPLAPSLVVAGAGSGKTETMSARVVYLVANGLVQPEHVLGLTFTRKAARQLAGRIRVRLRALAASGLVSDDIVEGVGGAEPEVSTYHAFAGRLLGEYGPLVGVEPSSRVLTPTSAWQLARRLVGRWEADVDTDASPDAVTEALLALSSVLADHLREPTELADYLATLAHRLQTTPPSPRQKGPLQKELQTRLSMLSRREWVLPLVAAFERTKRDTGVVDFADQMLLVARLVQAHPAIGAAVRARHRVVLLDEYQDTGHSQRVILRTLFGGTGDPATGHSATGHPATGHRVAGHPVTAVGDPMQSIYTWRGASAANLQHFPTDFPSADGTPAARFTLLTSFRNPPEVLHLANVLSDPIRHGVDGLRPRAAAPTGRIQYALFDTIGDENQWVAEHIADRWHEAAEAGRPPPTTAVLMRRRREMADLADALRANGLPVEVVGLGGLLGEPEVADIVAMLHLLVNPNSGAAGLRILTGARWQIGMADLAALADRAVELGGRRRREQGSDVMAAIRAALAEAATGVTDADDVPSLVDAIADPGPPEHYSRSGYHRIRALANELDQLRGRLSVPLPDLVADIERTIGLDVEVAVAGPHGRAHLDEFARVVEDFARLGGTVPELLDFLTTADEREDGLAAGEVEQAAGRVQILTVHAAKGLEFELVAVPQLSMGVFPSERATTWLGDAAQLPPDLRGDVADVPALHLPTGGDQSDVVKALAGHIADMKLWQRAEERRLAYVAVTRAEHDVLLSAHHWGATGVTPRGPGEFFTELRAAAADLGVEPDRWDAAPAPGAANPAAATPRSTQWPSDPLGHHRSEVERGADAVRGAMAELADRTPTPTATPTPDSTANLAADPSVTLTASTPIDQDPDADPAGWAQDVTALLAERASRAGGPVQVALPGTVSATTLVDLAADPAGLARRLRRPVPSPPAPHTRRGTAFHRWLEHRFAGQALLGPDELPGADDRDAATDDKLDDLRASFESSAWADRIPVRVEVPFSTRIGTLGVRGRIDAVFADPDGGFTVVDWKTGRPPSAAQIPAVAVQLAVYRLAWAALSGTEVSQVRACFHHVADNLTIAPADLLDSDGLVALIESVTEQSPADQAPA